jgi:hypothetical protein
MAKDLSKDLRQFRETYNPRELNELQQPQGTKRDHLIYQEKVYVPEALQEPFVKKFHEYPLHDHQGEYKTLSRLRRNFDFPGSSAMVKKVIKNYDLCNRSKASKHKPYGLLQLIPPPDRA